MGKNCHPGAPAVLKYLFQIVQIASSYYQQQQQQHQQQKKKKT